MVWVALVSGAIDNLSERKEMKKSELKNIIKECVKEVIFEEGVLSGIITEVAAGLHLNNIVSESMTKQKGINQKQNKTTSSNSRVLAAIAKDSYEEAKNKFSNPELFEGTRPTPSGDGKGPLSGIDPHDSGVDLSQIPGMSSWASVAKGPK